MTLDGSGRVVVQSGYSSIPGEGRVNISLAQAAALGVATDGKSPAQIAAALAENGANGIPLWESYVRGLDPSAAAAKPQATSVMTGENVALSLVGINVNEGAGATVSYRVFKAADLSSMSEWQVLDGSHAVDATAEVPRGATDAKMFYRLVIDVKGY